MAQDAAEVELMPLECFACPNRECDSFNRFGPGNLSVCKRMGKGRGRSAGCTTATAGTGSASARARRCGTPSCRWAPSCGW